MKEIREDLYTGHSHIVSSTWTFLLSSRVWRIPWTEEPGGLLSVGSHRVGHD